MLPLLQFPAVMECDPELWAKVSPFFFKVPLPVTLSQQEEKKQRYILKYKCGPEVNRYDSYIYCD